MEKPETDRVEKLVKDATNILIEHVDSVRIFVTYHEGNKSETASYNFGAGNFYAQLGSVHEWVTRQDQYVRENAKDRD